MKTTKEQRAELRRLVTANTTVVAAVSCYPMPFIRLHPSEVFALLDDLDELEAERKGTALLTAEQLGLLSALADRHISDAMVHSDDCAMFPDSEGECTCGVAAAYEFIDAALKEAKGDE